MEPSFESTSRMLNAGGINVHFNDIGGGPPVVMLHGGGVGASGWINFTRNVGFLSQHFRCLPVDLIGFGKTDAVAMTEPPMQRNARMIRDLLDALGIEKVSLIGNSFGGGTATAFAIDFPERTDRLVLMGPGVGHRLSMWMPSPTEGIKALRAAERDPTMESLRNLFGLMLYDSTQLSDDLLKARLDAALLRRRAAGSSSDGRDLIKELDKCKAKTLLIWGRDERFAPLDVSIRLLWEFPDAQLHVFSKCGHWAQFEKADEFNVIVKNFLLG